MAARICDFGWARRAGARLASEERSGVMMCVWYGGEECASGPMVVEVCGDGQGEVRQCQDSGCGGVVGPPSVFGLFRRSPPLFHLTSYDMHQPSMSACVSPACCSQSLFKEWSYGNLRVRHGKCPDNGQPKVCFSSLRNVAQSSEDWECSII